MGNSERDDENKPRFWHFRLYIAGRTTRSIRAIDNLGRVCQEYLPGRYQIEIIDLKEHPERAREENIIATPTLIRKLPPSVRKIVGDLSNKADVLSGIEISLRDDIG